MNKTKIIQIIGFVLLVAVVRDWFVFQPMHVDSWRKVQGKTYNNTLSKHTLEGDVILLKIDVVDCPVHSFYIAHLESTDTFAQEKIEGRKVIAKDGTVYFAFENLTQPGYNLFVANQFGQKFERFVVRMDDKNEYSLKKLMQYDNIVHYKGSLNYDILSDIDFGTNIITLRYQSHNNNCDTELLKFSPNSFFRFVTFYDKNDMFSHSAEFEIAPSEMINDLKNLELKIKDYGIVQPQKCSDEVLETIEITQGKSRKLYQNMNCDFSFREIWDEIKMKHRIKDLLE